MSVDGILLLDKPTGISSARAVAIVKRVLGGPNVSRKAAPKVGHLGTLDPFASGLLPLCVGEGTKLAPYIADADKSYSGVVRLGVCTDTLDGTGTVLTTTAAPEPDTLDLDALAAAFTGPQAQVPPAFSAIKKQGVPMYKLAREGKAPELDARDVIVHSMSLRAAADGRLELEADCSKGTYVRALARDIGERIGCGAILEELVRTGFGRFRLDDAVALGELEGRPELAAGALIEPAKALAHLPAIAIDAQAASSLRAGQQDVLAGLTDPAGSTDDDVARLLDERGALVAVVKRRQKCWRLDRVFRAPEPCAPGTAMLQADG